LSGTAAGAGGALAAEASAAPTDAFRIVDGRSTGLPGWTVDRYGPALLVQCFTPGGAAPEMLAQMLEIPAVLSLREPARVPIVLKERGARGAPGAGAGPDGRLVEGPPLPGALHPPASDDPLAARAGRVVVREDGVRYGCDLLHGQNTGIFLDARPLRSWVRAHAAGRRVLKRNSRLLLRPEVP
jgi:23S rRNA (cytosine1962-C5)-methyltransferase